ncbi:MAG: Sensor histidine kinase ResE [Actinobacteria bacterium]|nr:Sensor histidine kinase ResE [Actinomycetota bacterium]
MQASSCKAALLCFFISLFSLLAVTLILVLLHVLPGSAWLLWVLGSTAIASATSLLVGLVLDRKRMEDLREISRAVRAITQGELEQRVHLTPRSELGKLAADINHMVEYVRDQLRELSGKKTPMEIVLSNMADGVLVTDAQTRIIMCNPAAEKIFGFEASRVMGRRTIEVFPSYRVEELVSKALGGEEAFSEVEIYDPRRRILKMKVSPLRAERNEMMGVVLVVDDVTKVRQLEKARREFTANVSHELRTPISAIQALAEALLEGASHDPHLSTRFAESIYQETRQLANLVEDILYLSRLESEEIPLHKNPVSPGVMAEKAVDRFRAQAKEKRIELKVKIPPNISPIAVNEQYMIISLSNLLDNAIKYTPAGGTVSVILEEGEEEISFRVSDTGAGIPTRELPRIFERFYRVDKARSHESGSTGLGLSIAKHVVEKHGGRIEVKSFLGKGSTFTIHLPKNTQP